MEPIKRFFARLFGIGQKATSPTVVLGPEIRALIREEVDTELKHLVQQIVVPEIRQAVAEAVRSQANEPLPLIVEKPEPVSAPTDVLPEIVTPEAGLPTAAGIGEEVFTLEDTSAEAFGIPAPAARPLRPATNIRLGIDFGTTTTAVSIRIGDGLPEALPIGEHGATYMPSIAHFSPGNGELSTRVTVGEAAENFSDPTRIIRSVKRCLGCQGDACTLEAGHRAEIFPWCKGDGKIQVSDAESLLPEQIAYFIIREALSRAMQVVREQHGIDLDMSSVGHVPVNLGCGASFDLYRRQSLCDAAKRIGFADVAIKNVVEEPILAGFAFSWISGETQGRYLIYDFGGGTLDIAVVDVTRQDGKPLVTVLATAGDNWLGGDDIDEEVYKDFVSQIAGGLRRDRSEVEKELTSRDQQKLRGLARAAKESLSSSEQFENVLFSDRLGVRNLSLSRQEFETILSTSGLVQRSLDTMHRALKLVFALDQAQESDMLDVGKISRLPLQDAVRSVHRVVLVGGITKIPYVRQLINELFGADKVTEERVFEPISGVAIGAAYEKEAEHYSISAPPFGFELKYAPVKGQSPAGSQPLLEPYEQLEFYDKIYTDSIPYACIPFTIRKEYYSSVLLGKSVESIEAREIKDIGHLAPGNYHFYVGLDGTLAMLDPAGKPMALGKHPFRHRAQEKIDTQRQLRHDAEVAKSRSKTPVDDFKDWINTN